ncbi:glutamate synthase domain-containing protein 2 [Clostridium tetanomorphum]|uniref:FMN-binding glutamate synthase family protein n=1 Tax=Clostridium tetanomorphum TaxID=1553 RepID=A0A923J1W7_CLOTT|nr:FMN-binding glutamate synthase family protein [Clostridium tetanomorphum]KAJ49874.1 glutamate synthase family protein [Clostridium tetanomorphum DSM 665]MBC2398140.1 FMN-binding glutamate synthase family protein [Clostridium tetanomorphum]MBP1866493.1 glutamate synthase domain-containing protein 2 [Clostridium tetanomorphum]NRS84180.1 glutamate synthase domain-containing protein 2 [Clostridium tetanomorphum]NRZ97392.1 glutamate synthase domain-containing protein 2 [Clostridium tetanomorphum
MLDKVVNSIMNNLSDEMTLQILTKDYPENFFVMATAAEKLSIRAIVEACIRGESGKVLERTYGSPNVQSQWNKLFLNGRQLFNMPTEKLDNISTEVAIGKNCVKPLVLSIPVMITGMSYGGSLSLKAKLALAKGASLVGTATNTGESGVCKEEREAASILIGQYNRGGWLRSKEDLEKLDAIEIQMGQGAWGGAVPTRIPSNEIGEHLRNTWSLQKGEDAEKGSRMEGINSPEDLVKLVSNLKNQYGIPVGIKIAASHFIEKELDIITSTEADFIVIDGAEGGTSSAPPTLEDDMGIPTLFALNRTANYLQQKGVKDKYDLIITGGLKTPGEFLKALALGAKAVYIGSIAVIATIQSQIIKTITYESTPQLVLYEGNLKEELDVDKGAKTLSNFLTSCKEEMKLALSAMGKTNIDQLTKEDLVCVDKELSAVLNIGYAGDPCN